MSVDIECLEQQRSSDDVKSNRSLQLASPETNTINCRIGLDKTTGRVKWFPDCQFIRYLLVLPIVLMPIIIVFILMMQISSTFTGRIEIHAPTERIKISSDLEPYHRRTRNAADSILKQNCKLFHHFDDESVDIHEKELFHDIRTSFIPSKICLHRSHDVSRIAKNKRIEYSSSQNDNNSNKSADTDIDDMKYLDLLGINKMMNSGTYSTGIDDNNIIIDNNETQKQIESRQRREADNVSTPHGVNTNNASDISKEIVRNQFEVQPTKIPSILETFWRGEKSYSQIRMNQVEIIKQYMDPNVEPCDDFYQYACGNWEKLNPIPKDKASYDTFEMLREILDVELNALLAENDEANDDIVFETIENVPEDQKNKNGSENQKYQLPKIINAEQKAKYFYKSCMNAELLEKRNLEPLFKLLESLGGWPVLEGKKWNESTFDWLELAAKLRLYNNDVFLMQWVGPDIKNSVENIIQFDQTSLGLPTRDYFIQASNIAYLDAYQEFAKQVIFLCGASENDSAQTAEEIIKFETELALIMSSPEERMNVSQLYRRITIEALIERVPEIDWQKYLDIVFEEKIQRNETVVMFAMNFMLELVQLLNHSNKRIIANYMMWKFVRHRINSLDDRFQEAKQRFFNVLIGREKSPTRWKTCVNQVNSNMGMAVGAMFVRKYFNENSKQDTLAMTHELQESFRSILNETHWLEEETKLLAESKVNRMSLKIGYPDFILNPEKLNEKYSDLDVHPDRYFENILNVLIHLTRSEQMKLKERVNRTVWNTPPAVVNAYYSRNKNQIMFPAGILQPPCK